jgi:hypothetical protein
MSDLPAAQPRLIPSVNGSPGSSRFVLLLAVALAHCGAVPAAADFIAFGDKWDDPTLGTPAIVTWDFMTQGVGIDPSIMLSGSPLQDQVVGTNDIVTMRSNFDTAFGSGEFDAVVQRAFDTWAATTPNLTFVKGTDPGGAMGAAGQHTVDIRIGAFVGKTGESFDGVGAIGFGPPGNDLLFPDPLAGDIIFNLNAVFIQPAGNEGDPIGIFGNDLENLTLHELGHTIGLGHPSSGVGDVMFVGAGCCSFINRELSADDILGAQFIYGVPEPSAFFLPPIALAVGMLATRCRRRIGRCRRPSNPRDDTP